MGRPRNQEKQPCNSSDVAKKNNGVFKRRKQGILKKAEELSILCDIPVLVMVRSPSGELEVWPKDPCQVRNILENYRRRNPRENPEEISQVKVEETNQETIFPVPGRENTSAVGFEPKFETPENIYDTNAANYNDCDSYFGWKQSLASLGMNFEGLETEPLQICNPGQVDYGLDPSYLGNFWNGENLGFDYGVGDPRHLSLSTGETSGSAGFGLDSGNGVDLPGNDVVQRGGYFFY